MLGYGPRWSDAARSGSGGCSAGLPREQYTLYPGSSRPGARGLLDRVSPPWMRATDSSQAGSSSFHLLTSA